MNKKEYLKFLRAELKNRNVKNIDDIIEDYDDLIYQKMQAGKSEEEAVKELGPVISLADSYGKSQSIKGETDPLKFVLLQVFNIFVGFALLFSAISIIIAFLAVVVAMIVAIVIICFNLFTGAFSTLSTILIAISLVMGSIFIVSIVHAIIKVLYLLVHNYVLYNINTLKTKKLLYKKVRVKKQVLITSVASLVLAIVFGTLSFASSENNWLSDTVYVLNEVSVSSSDIEVYDEFYEESFNEDISSIKVEGIDVIVRRGKENKIEFNHEIGIEIDEEELTVKSLSGNYFANFSLSIDNSKNPSIIITTENKIDLLEIDGINVEIEDIGAKNYDIESIDLVIDEENEFKNKNIDIKIDSIDVNASFENFHIEDCKIDSLNIELNFVDSKVYNLDVSDALSLDLELDNTIIDSLHKNDFGDSIKTDQDSKIKNIKE